MLNKSQYLPIIICPCRIGRLTTIFYLPEKEVLVHAPESLIIEIIQVCNGEVSLNDAMIILGKKWQLNSVQEFIEHLKLTGIICDSRSVGNHVWQFVKNPTRFIHNLSNKKILQLVRKADRRNKCGSGDFIVTTQTSPFHDLLEKRHSTRTFSRKTVTEKTVAQLLWAGYGVVRSPLPLEDDNPQQVKVWQKDRSKNLLARHTVPSAGALYPIRLSLGLLYPNDNLAAGIYDVYYKTPGFVELTLVDSDPTKLLRSFADHTVCNDAQGVIVISGSFEISGEKYGNRSMLYVPLEAGHIAQNIHLSAAEQNIGTVEVGGFLEEHMRLTLGLPKNYWPLTTIIFGHAAQDKTMCLDDSNTELQWMPSSTKSYHLPFSMVFSRSKNNSGSEWACGRSKDPFLAASKALSEGYEWNACGKIPKDLVQSSFATLDGAIDPRKIVRYHNRQYTRKKFPLKPFDENCPYLWRYGLNILTNEKTFILSDCIYFPYTSPTPRYTHANSSGAAAHPLWEGAVRNATLELVERDAFMIVWLNRLLMPNIRFSSLPQGFQSRIRALQGAGFRVVVKDLTLDLTPVIFVFAQNKSLPLTTCAGCSGFETEEVLDHALMEVESAIYCRLANNQPTKRVRVHGVYYTDEHGSLYEQHEFFRRADFLFASKSRVQFAHIGSTAPLTWQQLLDQFHKSGYSPIVVDLLCSDDNPKPVPLTVVKVFIPGIIPMSFGYGLEPCGMDRIYNLPVHLGHQAVPMSYEKLTKFPHPYT
jgi:ribosomal protein S12 methylthiotransferase accessory factor